MTLLYLVRHGETDWNRQRRIQGSTAIPLNATGRDQAARTARLLGRRSWDAILTSPLSRAVETASIISGELGLGAPEVLEDIAERAYGAAEGLGVAELARLFPDDAPVPGRESREEVTERVIGALLRVAADRAGEHLVLTTHGGVIRAVLNAIAPSPKHRGVPITNGSIHSFRYANGGLQLVAFNDPIEIDSVTPGADDLIEQNAMESRES
jgi:uncharacterized phosphatase